MPQRRSGVRRQGRRDVGLYLNPPENTIVLAVDDCPVRAGLGPRSPTRPGKPAIQALERAQGYLKLPNGRALHSQAHEYRRRGSSTLFTALNVATGQIAARHSKRRRRVEFLARSALNGASFTSARQLRAAIDAFIEAYNPTATPFQWQQTKIHPKGLAQRIADL